MRRLTVLVAGLLASVGVLAGSAQAAAPQNTSPPTITGKEGVGETLTAKEGTWTGNPTAYDFQWQRCNREGDSCGNIGGQTDKTYKLQEADVGNTVRVSVTAQNSDGRTTENAKPTEVISGDAAPRVIERPGISGKAEVGETLTVDPGRWAEGPTFKFQWQSCDKSGGNCKDIAGATGKTYGVRAADKDNTIRVEVTATNLVGSSKANSDASAVVTSGTPTPNPTPVGVGGAISITAVSLPDRLVISQVQFTPRAITNRAQPVVGRFKVTEIQAGRPVSGALVYAVGVPSNRVTNASEVQTDSSGWATITFRPLKGLPMRQGARVTFFVRARKAGENPLAGVSTRRLVSVGVRPAG
jgi:hypothetical protein